MSSYGSWSSQESSFSSFDSDVSTEEDIFSNVCKHVLAIDCHESLWNNGVASENGLKSSLEQLLENLSSFLAEQCIHSPSDQYSIVFYNVQNENAQQPTGENGIYKVESLSRAKEELRAHIASITQTDAFQAQVGLSLEHSGQIRFERLLLTIEKQFQDNNTQGTNFVTFITSSYEPCLLPLANGLVEGVDKQQAVEQDEDCERDRDNTLRKAEDMREKQNVEYNQLFLPPRHISPEQILLDHGIGYTEIQQMNRYNNDLLTKSLLAQFYESVRTAAHAGNESQVHPSPGYIPHKPAYMPLLQSPEYLKYLPLGCANISRNQQGSFWNAICGTHSHVQIPEDLQKNRLASYLVEFSRSVRVYARGDLYFPSSIQEVLQYSYVNTPLSSVCAFKAFVIFNEKKPLAKTRGVRKSRDNTKYVRSTRVYMTEQGEPVDTVHKKSVVLYISGDKTESLEIDPNSRKTCRTGGKAGIHVLQAVPRSVADEIPVISHNYVLIADTERRTRSDVMMTHLCRVLYDKKWALQARVVLRDNLQPKMCLLVPFINELTEEEIEIKTLENRWQLDAHMGLYVVPLPEKDTVREPPTAKVTGEAKDDLVTKFTDLVHLMKIPHGYEPGEFHNPAIVVEKNQILAKICNPTDTPVINVNLQKEARNTVNNINTPEINALLTSFSGDKPEITQDMVAKMTIPNLKDYCKGNGIYMPSTSKKADYVDAINKHNNW